MPKKEKRLPVCRAMCTTCPFRDGSKYAYLAPDLAVKAITERSRICHSTGSGNAINHRTGKRPKLCRGARDIQLKVFTAYGLLDEPTDKEWEKRCKEFGL